MEKFKRNGSSCSIRQYLSAAVVLNGYEKRISEIFNSDEEIEISELKEINRNVKKILENLGIS